jgi:hypothetical protein
LAMALSMYPRSSLDSSCIHTSAFLIGWWARPLPIQTWVTEDLSAPWLCKVQVKESTHLSSGPGVLPLGEPGPVSGLMAFIRTVPDAPDQAPASYHVSETSHAVIWNQYFY